MIPQRCPGITWTLFANSLQAVCTFYNLRVNCCPAINNSSLLVSADMSPVPVAWQCLGWNIHTYIHFSSDISALWAEWHISPYLYSSLYLYNQVKEGNETITFTERLFKSRSKPKDGPTWYMPLYPYTPGIYFRNLLSSRRINKFYV
jgi:hypothetical protein